MGLTDGFVDVGLTRPEDVVEQLQWEKYERARGQAHAASRPREAARGARRGSVHRVLPLRVRRLGSRVLRSRSSPRAGAVAQQGGARSRCRRRDGGG